MITFKKIHILTIMILNRQLPNIIVPLNKRALNSVYRNELESANGEIAFMSIGRDVVDYFISGEIGLAVKNILYIEPDEYEEIESDNIDDIKKLKQFLNIKKLEFKGDIQYQTELFIQLLDIAIKHKTGIFFYF